MRPAPARAIRRVHMHLGAMAIATASRSAADEPRVRRARRDKLQTPTSSAASFEAFVRGKDIVDDLEAEYRCLNALGVVFTMRPTKMGPICIAVLADTCGNPIQIHRPTG